MHTGKDAQVIKLVSVPRVPVDTGMVAAVPMWPVSTVVSFVAVCVVHAATVTVAMSLVMSVITLVAAVIRPVMALAMVLLVIAMPATVTVISVYGQGCACESDGQQRDQGQPVKCRIESHDSFSVWLSAIGVIPMAVS